MDLCAALCCLVEPREFLEPRDRRAAFLARRCHEVQPPREAHRHYDALSCILPTNAGPAFLLMSFQWCIKKIGTIATTAELKHSLVPGTTGSNSIHWFPIGTGLSYHNDAWLQKRDPWSEICVVQNG